MTSTKSCKHVQILAFALFLSLLQLGQCRLALLSSKDNSCMRVKDNNAYNNANLLLGDCYQGGDFNIGNWFNLEDNPNLTPDADIMIRVNGKCLTIYGSGNGAIVNVYDCVGAPHQKWRMINLNKSDYKFEIQSVSSGKCLTGEQHDSNMYQWDCSAQPHQYWYLANGW